MTRTIHFLNKQFVLIVDDKDWDSIKGLKLYAQNVNGTMRAFYRDSDGITKRLDKKLHGFPCTHIDGNEFNLRKENCEKLDRSAAARRKPSASNTGCKGIRKDKRGRFVATYVKNSKTIHIGVRNTLKEACALREKKLREEGIA